MKVKELAERVTSSYDRLEFLDRCIKVAENELFTCGAELRFEEHANETKRLANLKLKQRQTIELIKSYEKQLKEL